MSTLRRRQPGQAPPARRRGLLLSSSSSSCRSSTVVVRRRVPRFVFLYSSSRYLLYLELCCRVDFLGLLLNIQSSSSLPNELKSPSIRLQQTRIFLPPPQILAQAVRRLSCFPHLSCKAITRVTIPLPSLPRYSITTKTKTTTTPPRTIHRALAYHGSQS